MDELDRGRCGAGRPGAVRTVACIDLAVGTGSTVDSVPSVVAAAVGRVRLAVRADDRICPVTTSRLAVEFGDSAGGVPPEVLGERLARAVDPIDGGTVTSASVVASVGVAEPEPHVRAGHVARRAMEAARAGTSWLERHGAESNRPVAVVTVDRLVASGPGAADQLGSFQSIHRRSIHRVDLGPSGTSSSLRARAASTPRSSADRDATNVLSILVVDPMGTADGTPGPAALAAAAVADRSGCRVVARVATPGDPPPSTVAGRPIDLAVITLDGGWDPAPSRWETGTWWVPALVTASLRETGVPVVAVSTGAAAGALASCVAYGAAALFGHDQLPDLLRSLGSSTADDLLLAAELHYPARFQALVGLTASERRVLFYLTEGWTAQDMTDELVVSLTTVRSHIRSVLRKLGVRSQLAAVAVANGRDLRRDADRPLT
jgi:DNA-binding NarL/FixJ family response regulator